MFQVRSEPFAGSRSEYATPEEFCVAFQKEMKPLYLLAFLLTAIHQAAELCLSIAVEEGSAATSVFKGWVSSWLRRRLIAIAIRHIFDDCRPVEQKCERWGVEPREAAIAFDAVAALPAFERVVFVMSVLERYTPQECSLLLGVPVAKVVAWRKSGLHALAEHDLPAIASANLTTMSRVATA